MAKASHRDQLQRTIGPLANEAEGFETGCPWINLKTAIFFIHFQKSQVVPIIKSEMDVYMQQQEP